jgi:hypothetical protein
MRCVRCRQSTIRANNTHLRVSMELRKQHTPLHVSLELLRNLDGLPTVDEEWYHILIDQLNWLQQTRPDLAYAILHLARGIKSNRRHCMAAPLTALFSTCGIMKIVGAACTELHRTCIRP